MLLFRNDKVWTQIFWKLRMNVYAFPNLSGYVWTDITQARLIRLLEQELART
jgi:hypothetical protein